LFSQFIPQPPVSPSKKSPPKKCLLFTFSCLFLCRPPPCDLALSPLAHHALGVNPYFVIFGSPLLRPLLEDKHLAPLFILDLTFPFRRYPLVWENCFHSLSLSPISQPCFLTFLNVRFRPSLVPFCLDTLWFMLRLHVRSSVFRFLRFLCFLFPVFSPPHEDELSLGENSPPRDHCFFPLPLVSDWHFAFVSSQV